MTGDADAGVPMNLEKALNRAAEETGVSVRSVKEMKITESGAWTSFATFHEGRLVSSPNSTLDTFNKCVTRRNVNDFYIIDKQRQLKMGLSTLRKVLRKLGFR
jgi:hypothetical protein